MENLKKWGLYAAVGIIGVWALIVSLKYFLFMAGVFGIGYVAGRFIK